MPREAMGAESQPPSSKIADDFVPQVISKDIFRSIVTRIDEDMVEKRGGNVYRNEEAALRLVKQHAPSIPVPEVLNMRG